MLQYNTYKPRNKKERERIKAKKSAERKAKKIRAETVQAQPEFKPNYNVPVRNSHLKITSGANIEVKAETIEEFEISEEMQERERLAQIEIERKKKCMAPAYNKGAYQPVLSKEQAKWVGK